MVSLRQVRKGETGDIQRPKIKAVWNICSEFLCSFPFSPFSKPSSAISILLSIYYVPGTMLGTVGTVKNGEEGNPEPTGTQLNGVTNYTNVIIQIIT